MGIAKGPKLGPNEVSPQKQPVVESELMANTIANVAIVNCFGRDIESTFSEELRPDAKCYRC